MSRARLVVRSLVVIPSLRSPNTEFLASFLRRREGDWQPSNHKDDARLDHNGNVLHSAQVLELLQHHWQSNPGFQTSQRRTNTEVDAVTKCQMAIGLTLHIEPIGVGELGWITIG